jgi:hypothetical protein
MSEASLREGWDGGEKFVSRSSFLPIEGFRKWLSPTVHVRSSSGRRRWTHPAAFTAYRGTSLIRNHPPPRTIHQGYAWDSMVIQGGGGGFL